jgi:hypothetical protein
MTYEQATDKLYSVISHPNSIKPIEGINSVKPILQGRSEKSQRLVATTTGMP